MLNILYLNTNFHLSSSMLCSMTSLEKFDGRTDPTESLRYHQPAHTNGTTDLSFLYF